MENGINLPCTLESKTSKEGNPYLCLSIKITNNYEKVVFLDKAEIELIKVMFAGEKNTSKISISKSS